MDVKRHDNGVFEEGSNVVAHAGRQRASQRTRRTKSEDVQRNTRTYENNNENKKKRRDRDGEPMKRRDTWKNTTKTHQEEEGGRGRATNAGA